MARIRFVAPGQPSDYVRVDRFLTSPTYLEAMRDAPASQREVPAEEARGTSVRIVFPGSADELQLFDVRMEPGLEVRPHAHVEDEIVFVLEGQLTFGSHVCEAGSSVFVPGMTLYGFKVGPDGARFLNFRGCLDFSNFTKEQFLAERRTEGSRSD